LDLSPGDEVVTAALTFSTDVAPLVRAGATPAFVDIEPDTFDVDAAGIAEMIGPRTKAILVPYLIGNAPDCDAIRSVADEHGRSSFRQKVNRARHSALSRVERRSSAW
jgi:CDP-4-dehydro-6-deoxyglucose reductase, E1